MTEQEAFNKVWQHFVVEGNPRASDGARCWYRHPSSGAKCALGILIPDEKYSSFLEHIAGWNMMSSIPEVFGRISLPFVLDLRQTHDFFPPVRPFADHMRVELTEIASQYELTIPA